MRVAILHGSNDTYGAGRVLVHEVQALVRLGHEVVVVLPFAGDLTRTLSALPGPPSVVIDPALSVLRRSNLRDALRWTRLSPHVSGADLVILWTLAVAHYIPALQRARVPFYVSVHELMTGRTGRLLTSLLRLGDFPVQACSFAVRDWLWTLGIDLRRLFVCYPTMEVSSREAPQQGRGTKVAVVGRINGAKGHLDVASAFQRCARGLTDAELHLFGSPFPGQERHLDELWELTRDDERIRHRGHVPDMSCLVGFSALATFPSRPESFGLVPIEAWTRGVPTIGYAEGGAREVFEWVGATPVRRTWDSLRDIGTALEDVWAGRRALPMRQVLPQEPFSAATRTARVAELIDEAVGGSPRRPSRAGRRVRERSTTRGAKGEGEAS